MAKRNWWLMAVLTVVVAVACSTAAPTTAPTNPPGPTNPPTGAPGPTDAPTEAPGPTTAPTDAPPAVLAVPEVPTGYAELDTALTPKADGTMPFAGTRATIQTQWIGGEGDNFDAAIKDFEAATGIDIVVDSVGTSHETLLRTRIEGNDPTLNMAMLAQPAAVLAYGAAGKLANVNTFMTGSKLADEHPATIALYTDAAGATYGIPFKVDVKSTIWYPIKAFEAAGYEVPTTWDELMALADTIVAAGSHPFCVGIESGTATGWEATDLLEDIMLRTASVEDYNKWITHELPFNSPQVLNAMNLMADYYFTPDYVLGGTDAILGIHLTDPMDPMFPGDPPGTSDNWDGFTPGCWMHKIPTWYGPDFFPDVKAGGAGTQTIYPIGEDIGIFYFPEIDPAFGTPALGAGDALMVIQPPDGSAVLPQVMAAAEFLSLPTGLQNWIAKGSAISANQTTPADWYAGAYKLSVAADIVNNATGFGFDASDLMPPEVGAGAEWTELSNWIHAGGADTEAVLQRIDDAWPQ